MPLRFQPAYLRSIHPARMALFLAWTAAAALSLCDTAAAATYRANPATYRALLSTLRPGDTLALAAGEYRAGLPLHNVSGEPARPITISGPGRGAVAVFRAREGHNTISIADASYLVIRNLVLEGDNLPVDAVKAERQSRSTHDITIENLVIRGHGNNQQNVGISTKCPSWRWTIRGNRIFGAGTGMYLGDSDGSAPFVAGVIENNLVVDTLGYNLQIKHQQRRPDVQGIPVGASTTIIRHNVFAKTSGGTAEAARPNVLVGHFPVEGPGAEDDYAIYGNFFYQNRHEALFQGEGNVALYSNLFVNTLGDAVHIQPHNDIPRRITIAFNTVIAEGTGISITQKEGAPAFRQIATANAVFAAIPITGGEQAGNVTGSLDKAPTYLAHPLAPLGQLDLHPRRSLVSGLSDEPRAAFPAWTMDFDGRPRPPGKAGAYGGQASDSAWKPRLERKPGGLK